MFDRESGQLRIWHEIARNLHLFAQSLIDLRCGLGGGWNPHHRDCEPVRYVSPGLAAGQRILCDSWMGSDSEERTDRLPRQSDSAGAVKYFF